MTLPEIAKYRMVSQQLLQPTKNSAEDMVKWFGAIQAQEYAQTKWSVGLRLPQLNDDEMENDFIHGRILRTHLLRPTWHLVSSEDIRWMLKLTAPRVNAANAYMYRKLELDSTIFNRSNKILIKTLQGNEQRTRTEINREFKRNKIIAEGHRLSYIMMYAELAGIICSGARKGNQFTYALLDERVQPTKSMDDDEALAKLACQYFSSRGPATVKDFSTWSGLTLTDCRKGLEMTKSTFIKEVIEDEAFYFSAGISLNEAVIPGIFLLPVYDEFIMGYKDRSAILELKKNLYSSLPFRYDSMMVADGQLIGTWKRTVIKSSIDMEYQTFKPMSKRQQAYFANAITRFEDFTNMAVNLKSKGESI